MQRIGPDQYCTCLSVRNCWFKETRRRRWSRSQYGIFCPDETRKFTFRLFIIYLHFTTPSLVFSLLFQGFKRPIASYFTRLKTLAVSKCPPAGRIEWQTSVLVNELWFVEHVKVVSFTFQVERKWLFEMSSTGYKPLNDTDTDEELKTIQGKLK